MGMDPVSVLLLEVLLLVLLVALVLLRQRPTAPARPALKPNAILIGPPLESNEAREERLEREALELRRRMQEMRRRAALDRRAAFFDATPRQHAEVIKFWLQKKED